MRTTSNPTEICPFDLEEALNVLERTPEAMSTMLRGLPDLLVRATEGEDTWSPYDVIGHLIHGERTDWIPRLQHILAGETRPFEKFDRTAQFSSSVDRTLSELLDEFDELRKQNVAKLKDLNLTEIDFAKPGLHPELGDVTLSQLLATWVVHDLDHIVQVARILAKRHTKNVGPWTAYLSILHDRE